MDIFMTVLPRFLFFTLKSNDRIVNDMQHTARFRFHFSLIDFLAPAQRNSWVMREFEGAPAIKDVIEAIGVPHTEIDVLLVNCKPVTTAYQLKAGDEVEIYPASVHTMWPTAITLLPVLPENPAFIVDVHLGKLARLLRMLGFDTLYNESYSEKEMVTIATTENRILLSRGVGIFKHKNIRHGYWLRSQLPEEQLHEVVSYYKLPTRITPFTRCMGCNGLVEPVAKDIVVDLLPPKTKLYYHEFYQCGNCRHVYWKGSHYKRMLESVNSFSKL
jgi:uncharacterized protein